MPIVGLDVQWMINGAEDKTVLRRMSAAFERNGSELLNFEKHLWPLVTVAFETEMTRQFSEEGAGPGRGTWAELSPDYAKWKAANFPGQPILQRTGDLMRAMTNSGDVHALRTASGDTFEFGTRGIEYASFHQLGTYRMPDRPPFDFSADFQRDLNDAGLQAVRAAAKESGVDEFVEVRE